MDTQKLTIKKTTKVFRDICTKTYKCDPPHFNLASRLPWKARLKKMKAQLEI